MRMQTLGSPVHRGRALGAAKLSVAVTLAVILPTHAAIAADPSPPPREHATSLVGPVAQFSASTEANGGQRDGLVAWGEEVLGGHLCGISTTDPTTLQIGTDLHHGSRGAEFPPGDVHNLLTIDEGGTVRSFSFLTGEIVQLGEVEPHGDESFSGLATSPTTGVLYAISTNCLGNSSLYTLDPDAITLTRIGIITGGAGGCVVAIAADDAGNLWGLDLITDMLLGINSVSAAGTVVGVLHYEANYSQGMDFDDSGTCYVFAFNETTYQAELRTCSTVTGATSLVDVIGDGSLVNFGSAAFPPVTIFSDGFESGTTGAWSAQSTSKGERLSTKVLR